MCGKAKEKEAILLSYDWELGDQGQRVLVWGATGEQNILFVQII